MFDQEQDAKLRDITDVVEHAFAREDAAGGDAVQAADELLVEPSLDAVRVPLPVERGIRGNHGGRYPRPVLPWPWRGGAGVNHGDKIAIDREGQIDAAALRFTEALRDVQPGKLQDGTVWRTNPWDRMERVSVRPWEDPMSVGRE